MRREPLRSSRTASLFPYTTLFRSRPPRQATAGVARVLAVAHLVVVARRCDVDRDAAAGAGDRHAAVAGRARPDHRDAAGGIGHRAGAVRSEEHTSELQSPMRNSYSGF